MHTLSAALTNRMSVSLMLLGFLSVTPATGAPVVSFSTFGIGAFTDAPDINIDNSSEVTTGTWLRADSPTAGSLGNNTTSLLSSGTTSTVTFNATDANATGLLQNRLYQFIDVTNVSGLFELSADFRRRTSFDTSLGPQGDVSIDIFGIEDTGVAGWTTTGTNGFNLAPSFEESLSLVDANVSPLGSPLTFSETVDHTGIGPFINQSTQFTLTPQIDQVVLRINFRHPNFNAGDAQFELTNVNITAVPEPSMIAVFAVLGCVIVFRWRCSNTGPSLRRWAFPAAG